MATVIRRGKWHPPPPPTPRILHLPRRSSRRKQPTKTKSNSTRRPPKGKLETLFDQERAFSYTIPPVVLLNSGERKSVDDVEERESEEEKWRFQAEMLRAECNFLRMEREIAVKKLGRERGFLEKSLKSAVHTLLSGRKKIGEGENKSSELEEEIEELAKKLVELQRSIKAAKDPELKKCSNFDKQACLLQKQLDKFGEMANEDCVMDTQEALGSSLLIEGFGSSRKPDRFADVETLRRKMEALSMGRLLKRMEEEYGSMLSARTNCSVPSSASTSRRYDLADLSSLSFLHSSQDLKLGATKACSGHCKAIVTRIMEQVRAETEQWSEMQEMLGQVRVEMEELQASRDFWESRALESDHKIRTLHSEVDDWKRKAISLEVKENQIQKQVQELQEELEKLRAKKVTNSEVKASKDRSPLLSLGAQLEKEKRLLTCRVKGSSLTSEKKKIDLTLSDGKKPRERYGSRMVSPNRHPFRDISNVNVSPLQLLRQNSRRYVYPLQLHSPLDS